MFDNLHSNVSKFFYLISFLHILYSNWCIHNYKAVVFTNPFNAQFSTTQNEIFLRLKSDNYFMVTGHIAYFTYIFYLNHWDLKQIFIFMLDYAICLKLPILRTVCMHE